MLTETLDISLDHADAPLSLTGERQVSFKLKTKEADLTALPPDVVVSSPLRRALLTAFAAYPEKKIRVDPRLREMCGTDGMKKEELERFVAD